MAFIKKLWKDRISEFPNRRTINDGHTVKQATIGRDEGIITEEGDDFSAQNMNDLEQRIEDCFGDVQALVGYEVAQQYNQSSVIFDPVATEGHGTGFVVSSDYIAKLKIENLKDVEINSPQPNQALVFDLTDPDNPKLVNGEVSTVGNLDDLSDVDTTGKANDDSLRYDNANHKWVAKPVTVVMSQSAWEGMSSADKTAWINSHKNTHLILSDAPNLNPTASDIEYSSGVTVKQAIDNKANKTGITFSKTLLKSVSQTTTGLAIDISGYDAIFVDMTYYSSPINSAFFFPKNATVETFRISGSIDALNNFATIQVKTNTSNQITELHIIVNFGNACGINVYGVKFVNVT